MKIGFISPFRSKVTSYYSNNPGFRSFCKANKNVPLFFHPNLALLTLAALTPEDFEVELIDERIDTLNYDSDYDIIGISMITAQARRGYEIAGQFRKRDVYTVMGGIHPTVCPEEAADYCDTLILGEAENIWPQFLSDFQHGNPKKIYRDSGIDITRSPVPRYDLVDTKQFHLFPIQTTRGCPHDCNFCSVTTVFGPKYRIKNTDQIIRELEAIQKVSKNKRCVFNDDNMFVNKKRSYEILEAIKPLGMKYFAETDISIADDDKLLGLLRESGCVTVFIGFESLVSENLAGIQKSGWKLKHLKNYEDSCARIQSYGIQVFGSFLVGLDYDTRDKLTFSERFCIEEQYLGTVSLHYTIPGHT